MSPELQGLFVPAVANFDDHFRFQPGEDSGVRRGAANIGCDGCCIARRNETDQWRWQRES